MSFICPSSMKEGLTENAVVAEVVAELGYVSVIQ